MIQYDELKQQLNAVKPNIEELGDALGIDELKKELSRLEQNALEPDFWNDSDISKKTLQKTSQIKAVIAQYDQLYSLFDDTQTLMEMGNEADDLELINEAKDTFKILCDNLEEQKLKTLLSGEYDTKNAIIAFHSGAGGTEAQDWVLMLYRMYIRWADRHGFTTKVLNYLDGDEAGIKSATIQIEGLYAYGFLKSESGVHRLVRISPFDSSGRRHTSFASLEVMPEIDEDTQVDVNESDLKIDTFRASGAGGQHVNTTDSAVRITHIPTGVVVACQNERSQHQNKDVAMKMLKSKLAQIKEREHLDKIEDIKGEQKEIAWGYQIRSYVFMPYTLVKDHRSNFEVGNVSGVMDGDIDGFINAYLKGKSKGEIE